MITEDYVSFDTAKLLKEKGFGELTYACFTTNGQDYYGYRAVGNDIMRPTLQMARKWLRKAHNIDISVTPDRKTGYSVLIFKDKRLPFDTLDSYSTYEEACEAAIKYCLEKLI